MMTITTTGQITSISLAGKGLTGELHNIWQRITSNLTALETLALPDNKLEGSVPAEWSKLRHLRDVDISYNDLTGSLPTDLFGVHGPVGGGPPGMDANNGLNLTRLNLASNKLVGAIPAKVTNMTSLVDLNLANNRLTGSFSRARS